ncbi:MAG: PAS domain-containing protein, partial [Salinibacter sp.]
SDGIYRLVPGDGLVYANRAFARLFAYDDVAALLALEPEVLYANPDQQSHPLHVGEEADRRKREVAFRRKDGSTFVGLLSGTVVRDENGEIQHIDGVVTDITDLKEREHILKGERDRFETLFEALLQEDDPSSG